MLHRARLTTAAATYRRLITSASSSTICQTGFSYSNRRRSQNKVRAASNKENRLNTKRRMEASNFVRRRSSANLNGSPLRASPNGTIVHSSTCSSLNGHSSREALFDRCCRRNGQWKNVSPLMTLFTHYFIHSIRTVCERIIEEVLAQNKMSERKIFSLSQDAFYRNLNTKEIAQAEKGTFNFDHPGMKQVFKHHSN